MDSARSWQQVLRTPHRCDHVVQMYTDDAVIPVDAQSCLAQFMIDGRPDPDTFRVVTGGLLDRVRRAGYDRVRLFGEMVDLLWQRDLDATIEVEELWNVLLGDHRVCLLCGYAIDPLDHRTSAGVLHRISRSHSHPIPVDDCELLDEAVDRAHREVFGESGDPAALREALVARHRGPAMPQGQAALNAIRELSGHVGDQVLARAREHYRGSTGRLGSTRPAGSTKPRRTA